MRALRTLKTLSLLCSTIVLADTSLESYISQNKAKQFEYDYQKNKADSSQLRDSWIAPINLRYLRSKSNPLDVEQESKTTTATLDQPIFASGGIYYGIKYANASKKYANYSVDVAKRKLIKEAISLLIQIKQTDLKIERQNLSIKNADINLEIKKEQYLSGQLDSSFLDSAIIERNSVISALYDIESAKESLISSFKVISDIDYSSAKLPLLDYIEKEQFLTNNILLDMSQSEIERNDYNKGVVVAKYLPKLNLTAGYTWSEYETPTTDSKDDYYNYGFKVTMPIDINTFRDIESSNLTYLKSQINIEDTKKSLISIYDKVTQNLKNFDKKIKLSKENKNLYQKLLDDTKKLYEVGYKTDYDVQTLQNSFSIQDIEIEILKLDKQLELLNLYETYKK
jgi:outer membrane protein TolC